MKYIRRFENESDYQAFRGGGEWITPNIVYINENSNLHLQPYVEPPYLIIEALEDGLTAKLSKNACEYCVDGDRNWKTLAAGTATETINSGQTLFFRGNLTPASHGGIGTFTINKKCNLKGNCMSMLFGDNAANNFSLSGKSYAFYQLFYNCTNIVNVSSNFLPATTLASGCYNWMFCGCKNLTTAPELPATTLTENCYQYMFQSCANLTTAPELPATTLANSCYSNMFNACTSLTTIPSILPATALVGYCYSNMFRGCSSLTTAPELPATTLTNSCYSSMFSGCSKLNHIKMLATDLGTNSLYYWLNGVASNGTFVKNAAMTSLPTGKDGIPEGWTVVNDGEESGGGSNLITFTVEGIEFQTEKRMTWEQFINSEYNDGYYFKMGDQVGYVDRLIALNGINVKPSDSIVEMADYTTAGYEGQ